MRVFTDTPATIRVMVILALALTPPAEAGDYCKWTDEQGVVHYSETCPEDIRAETITTQDERTEAQIRAAREHTESLLAAPIPDQDAQHPQRYRSLPRQKLGPLPANSISDYLVTKAANYALNSQTRLGNFVLFLEARENMPEGAWVEAAFPDPADISRFDRVGAQVGPGQRFSLQSPPTRDLRCWNYLVEVDVFHDSSRNTLIGTHRQVIQSQVNLKLVRNTDDLLLGVTSGLCMPGDRTDFSRMTADELEALCQQEREKRLAPERAKLIRDCVRRQGKSQAYCEQYYADFGDARRTGPGQMQPALYLDLPACVAAREARARER